MPTESEALLGGQESKATKIHYLALLCVSLGELGDSVEFFLPAVITQPVSCELGLSRTQENMLALALYISSGVFSIITIPFLRRFPRRPIILFSLYLSIIATIFCAAVPDYLSLVLSRVFIGLTIAINLTPMSVYISEVSPNKQFYVIAAVLKLLGWTIGGGWCGILGYLFLERIGWRWFVLVTSIPLFLPPLVAFQFFLPETKKPDDDEDIAANKAERVTTPKVSMVSRIMKLQLFNVCRSIPFHGAMLLLPALIKDDNARNDRQSPCNAIHGVQFLAITLLFGGCRFGGICLTYLIRMCVKSSAIIFVSLSLVVAISTGLMPVFITELNLLIVCLGFVQTAISVGTAELDILTLDKFFFTPSFLPISTGIRYCLSCLISVVASAISELLPIAMVLRVHFGVSIVMLVSSLLFFIRD